MQKGNSISNNSVPRHLITTADERTWKFDRPVLFLGEWCCRYDRRHLLSTMDALVAKPYGFAEGQKDRGCDRVNKLAAELLHELVDILNRHHDTNHSLRYWRILLGHWLYRYTSIIFNRFFTFEQTINQYEISGITVFKGASYSLATPNSMTFIWACCSDDIWNNVLDAKVLNFVPGGNIQPESLNLGSIGGFRMGESEPPLQTGKWFQKLVRQGVNSLLPLLSRRHDAFIITSYLPLKEDIKLQLRLAQLPQFWRSPKPVSVEPDRHLRERLSLNISGREGFEQCARALLLDLLPTCYLEGYPELQDQVRQLPWPEKPKFIFTSNSFDTDEVFKTWAGSQIERGAPYYTGQHGNNYGTHAIWGSNDVTEIETSDKFLTWGWNDGNSKQAPAFVFTSAGKKKSEPERVGGLQLIERPPPLRLGFWDEYPEFRLYQEGQFRFVENLPPIIQQELTVRLYGGHKKRAESEEQRWRDQSPGTKLDDGTMNIRKSMSNSRLIVYSYDSTGILENLAQNIPTLCFWYGGLDHLRETAKPYYKKLQQAGILLNSAELAAKKVAEVWDDVPTWWNSETVQSARKIFCDRYARVSSNPVSELKQLLVSN